ncbi:MAG: hypothetical protein K5767_07755 [Clostridia bacterium]|nr:hypothetical protein [Clostridia bacterium]
MRDVFDYKDIRRLDETSISEQIKNGLVVAATHELANAMRLYYPEYSVVDVHQLVSNLVPEWDGSIHDLKNYVSLRNVIEDYILENNLGMEVSTHLRRNAADMWNAIKLLTEADVYPDDVDESSSESIYRFKEIWSIFESNNEQIIAFRKIFSEKLSNRDFVSDAIGNMIGETREHLYLFGFYFITPLQDRLFDVLEENGIHLHFLNCHDHIYEYATRIWEKTFPQYGEGEVIDLQENLESKDNFREAILRKPQSIPVEVTCHFTEFDFATMVKSAIDRGETVYSPDAKQCETILKEYFPEYYQEKHLLSYPVGQYIYNLHMMWDSIYNVMNMEYEYVYKCFSSGWVNVDDLNGRDYLYEVKCLEPYFKFCHSISDWEERLATLRQAKEATDAFNKREKGNLRWHKLLGNPFENLAVYALDLLVLEDIDKLIHKLIVDAEYLFGSGTRTDLYEHFSKIANIINQHCEEEDTHQLESAVIKDLLGKLDDETARGIECPLNGIRDAIIMLIGDHLGDYETFDQETSFRRRMVIPLSMVEAAMLNNYGEKVHLVFANEFTLPGKPRELPWPLTDAMLDSLRLRPESNTMKYVRDMRSVIDNRPLSYRYLFYSFMGISNDLNDPILSIEWLCVKDNKDVDVSPYVKLLGLNDKLIRKTDRAGTRFLEDYMVAGNSYLDEELDMPEGDVPEIVKMDFLLCKYRYIYSYLLNYLPSFSQEFHYSFALSKLISAFTIVSGIGKDIVSENVAELFPFLRNVEIQQSRDFAKSQGKPEPKVYDGIEYPGQVLLPHYLNENVIKSARKLYDDFVEDGVIGYEKSKEMCIYCPYSSICMKRYDQGELNHE